MRWIWLSVLLAGPAWAQDGSDREAAMFGGTESEGSDREASMFGGAEPDQPAVAPTPGPVTQAPVPKAGPVFGSKLAVGGRLYVRGDVTISEETDAGDQRLQMPNLLDVYLDARPSDRVRAYARFRLTYNPVADDSGDAFLATPEQAWQLQQLWLKWDWAYTAFFTVGTQPVRWGTGRVWNPTDVINRARLDPLAPLDLRSGRPLAKVQFPLEAIGGQLELIADLDDASRLGNVGLAARLQAVAGPTEWSLSARYQHDRSLMVGLDGSAGLGPIDVYGEVALQHGGHPLRSSGVYRLPSDAAIDAGPLEALAEVSIPTMEDRDDDWIPQAVVGVEWPIQYSDEDQLLLGAEYFYNDSGYSDASLYPWLLTSGGYDPFYLGRHYAAVFAVLMAPGDWNDTTLVLTALGNVSDRTGIARLNVSHRVLQYLSVEPYIGVPFGALGGEFRLRYEVTAKQVGWIEETSGVQLPFESGLVVPAAVLQAGLWLKVEL